MALTYIKIFMDWLDAIEPLDDGERGRLFTALLRYARTGEVPELSGNERFLFPVLRTHLDREAAAYEAVCEANRINGAKGGRPRKKPNASLQSQEEDKEEDQDKGKDQYKGKEKKEKDSSFCGAGGPAQRKHSSRSRSSPSRQDCPETVRQDMERMEKYLLQLRRGDVGQNAPERKKDGPENDGLC